MISAPKALPFERRAVAISLGGITPLEEPMSRGAPTIHGFGDIEIATLYLQTLVWKFPRRFLYRHYGCDVRCTFFISVKSSPTRYN
jgi:hypothetical protein